MKQQLINLAKKYLKYEIKEICGATFFISDNYTIEFDGKESTWKQIIDDHSDLLTNDEYEWFERIKNA
jgi:hypothetical protein